MAAEQIEVGFATPSDAPTIASMSRDLIEIGLGWTYQPPRVAKLIRDPDCVALLTREGARTVGFALMGFGEERASPSARGLNSIISARAVQNFRGTVAVRVEPQDFTPVANVFRGRFRGQGLGRRWFLLRVARPMHLMQRPQRELDPLATRQWV